MKSNIITANNTFQFLSAALSLLMMCSVCQSQEILYEMNFDDFNNYNQIEDGIYEFPEGWVQYDVDGTPLNINQTAPLFPEPNVGFSLIDATLLDVNDVHEGVAVASSFFEGTENTIADDWLSSPEIEIPSTGLVLTWEAKSQDVGFKESYEVFITTAGNDVNTLTSLTTEDRVKNIVAESDEWTKHSVNLSDYAGETIYIAFHLYSNDNFFLLVDNIQILDLGNSVDVVLNTPSLDLPIQYGMMPFSQIEPIGPFTAPINSISGVDIGDVKFTVIIEEVVGGLDTLLLINSANNLVFEPVWEKSATFAGPYEPFSLVDLKIDDLFTPDHEGLYTIKYEIEHEEDQNIDNNISEKYYFAITDKSLARHAFYHTYLDPPLLSDFDAFFHTPDDVGNDDVENDDLTPVAEYGMVVELDKFSVLDSVSLLLNAPTGNISVNVYTYSDVTGISTEPIATRKIDFGPSGNTISFYILSMLESEDSEPVNLAPGKYFISANDPNDGSLTLVFCNYYNSSKSAFIKLENSSGWTELNEVVPVIDLVLGEAPDPATAIEISTTLDGAIFTGTATSNGFVESYAWDFGNGDTQEGAFITYAYNVPGTYQICLSANTGDQVLEECTEVTIGAATTIDFTFEVTDFTVEFTSIANGAIMSYDWDFDEDGNNSDQENPTYTYESEGTYNVCLSVDTDETTTLDVCKEVELCDFNGNVVATNTEAIATTIGGLGPFTFIWKDAAGNEIMTTDQGIITGLEPVTDYSVIISDVNGCSYELSFTTLLENVGIYEIELLQNFSVFPTPAQTFVQLNASLSEVAKISYEIVDITGRKIISVDLENNDQVNETINTEALQNGYYLLILDINGKQISKKIIIQ